MNGRIWRIALFFLAVTGLLTTLARVKAEGNGFVEVKGLPGWAEEYDKMMASPMQWGDYGMKSIVNPSLGVKITAEESKGIFTLRWYKSSAPMGVLQTSKVGFHAAQWSRDGKFFTIVNLTYAFDWHYDGTIYVYRYEDAKLRSVFVDTGTGGNPRSFSRTGLFLAYGTNHRGLVLLDLNTFGKKVIGFPEPSREGIISYVAWDKDDRQLVMIYVMPADITRYYVYKLS